MTNIISLKNKYLQIKTYDPAKDGIVDLEAGGTGVDLSQLSDGVLYKDVTGVQVKMLDDTGTSTMAFIPIADNSGVLNLNSLRVKGNLTVDGTTTTINSTEVSLDDLVLNLGGDTAPTTDDGKDRGITFRWHDGTNPKIGFLGYDRSTGQLVFIPDATETNGEYSGTSQLSTDAATLNGQAGSYYLNRRNHTGNNIQSTEVLSTGNDFTLTETDSTYQFITTTGTGAPVLLYIPDAPVLAGTRFVVRFCGGTRTLNLYTDSTPTATDLNVSLDGSGGPVQADCIWDGTQWQILLI